MEGWKEDIEGVDRVESIVTSLNTGTRLNPKPDFFTTPTKVENRYGEFERSIVVIRIKWKNSEYKSELIVKY